MNPEIRFRVSDDIYQRAEDLAQELGFSGKEAGRSAGVPLLARAAFYDWLGVPWPQDWPRPTHMSSMRAGRESKPETTLAGPESAAQVRLEVSHLVREDARWTSALGADRRLPLLCQTILSCSPHELPPAARPYLRLDSQGDLVGRMKLLDLVAQQEQLTWEELERFLLERKSLRATDWEETLRQWSLEFGSDWLKARIEEGFDWSDLAEQEWARAQVEGCVQGQSPLVPVADQQSLSHAQPFDALLPDRQPSWERIQLLRAMRGRCQPDGPLRLSLVRGHKERVEARRRSASQPFLALLWQVDLPGGGLQSFLSHLEPDNA